MNKDIVAIASKIRKKLRSQGLEVPKNIRSVLLNNKGQFTDFPYEDQNMFIENGYEPPQQLATGGSIISDTFNKPFKFNEFNEGGKHETNSLGGIPQGVGANGKMNTVEEDETSMTTDNGKFIFSHRLGVKGDINQYVGGGMVDPPTKLTKEAVVGDSKDFVKNWFNDSTTKARYSANVGKGFNYTLPKIEEGLSNLNKTTVNYNAPTDDESVGAEYKDSNIDFYKSPTSDMATHEFTHAMGVDKDLTKYIRDNYGTPAAAIQGKTGLPFKEAVKQEFNINDSTGIGKEKLNNTINHSRYLSENGELYPRVMEMRKHLNVKPGDIINDDQIKELQTTDNPLFKYYSPEQIKGILNTVADNGSNANTNEAAMGGPVDPPSKKRITTNDLQSEKDRVKNYLSSSGYKRILSKHWENPEQEQSNRLKNLEETSFRVNGDEGLGSYNKAKKQVSVAPYSYDDAAAHEFIHASAKSTPTKSGLSPLDEYEIDDKVKDPNREHYLAVGKEPYIEKPEEFQARLNVARMLMEHNKLWDINKGEFTKEHLKKLKANVKKYPDRWNVNGFNDVINSTDDEGLIYLLNSVADNSKSKNKYKNLT
ncbi:tail protein [Cellulophaga phage phi14:2]|uniref:Structural protein n=1 Tax=Cellulophaga phage phi14:2 TaxID=1327990 RepID=S0A053_9CAUD|nr:tail protein [Cellulophaga phage phi14:2]AGO48959.1 structural protein [Cellulophaga phage phi14:2]